MDSQMVSDTLNDRAVTMPTSTSTSVPPNTSDDMSAGQDAQILPSQSPPVVNGRNTRHRNSLPAPSVHSRTSRGGPPKDLDKIKERYGPSGIARRREELVKEKEEALRQVVDDHDTFVREKFHLERYTSLLEGWDPVHVKQEQSPVFLDYVHKHHNLLDLIPPTIGTNAAAGPSRTRTFAHSRTTRRQLHEKSELIAAPAPMPISSPRSAPCRSKIKARGKIEDVIHVASDSTSNKDKGKSRINVAADVVEMPPPPLPHIKGRRATIGMPDTTEATESSTQIVDIESDKKKSRKRGRMSLPILPAKKLRSDTVQPEESSSPAQESPSLAVSAVREDSATLFPSLADIPFPPPPIRPRERVYGSKRVWYTDPSQLPPTDQKFGGSIDDLLQSYIHLEDTGPSPTLESLEARAAKEGFYRNRVNWLQHQGRLLRLIEEAEAEADLIDANLAKTSIPRVRNPALAPRQTDFQDSLMSHMTQVRNAMMSEAKSKPIVCKKVARMIMAYWEHEQNKGERERLAEEKDRKKKAKEVVKALRRRWALAVKIVRAKLLQQQKEEQDRLGKEHLQNMLWRSSGLLEGQRGVIMGEEAEEDEDGDSDGTDDVSEAETSDDEEEEGTQASDSEDEDGVSNANMSQDPAQLGEQADESFVIDGVSDRVVESTSVVEAEETEEVEEVEEVEETEDVEDTEDEIAEHESSSNEEDEDDADDEHSATDRHMHLQALIGDQDPLPTLPASSASPAMKADDASERIAFSDMPVAANSDSHNRAGPSIPNSDADESVNTGTPDIDTAALVSAVETPPEAAAVREDLNQTALPVLDGQHLTDPLSLRAQPEASEQATSPAPASTEPVDGNAKIDYEVKPESAPIYRPRSRRARQPQSASAMAKIEDPDADDVEFKDEANASDQDHQMDLDMENNDASDDDEDAGLLADADLPIEELLKRYGYPGICEPDGQKGVQEGKMDIDELETGPEGVVVDKSLLDESLDQQSPPGLIIEGKRNRRVRSVWTPEENPPHPPPAPKRPKIEEVEEQLEPTPSLTSEETDDEDDEDEVDEEMPPDEDSGKVRPPFLLRGTLRPYQQAGLEWLASLYANKMNGILADEMGLGKTIQTISLLGHLACDKGVWGQHLIIVPTSVILNWEMEFKKFLPGLKILTYYGNQKERKEKRKGWHSENTWQVCITSYQIVLADQHIFRRKNWVYMILDEAHNIKNFRSQRWQTLLGFKASRRLLLTGTPLQNNLMELWSLLYFLMPNGVAEDATAVVGFANHKEFSEWFSNPMDKAIETGDTLDEETLETVAKLHTLLRPFILRRLKSEVETQLPGKFEHVVYCKLSKRQRFLYDEFMSRASTREALTSGGYLGVVNTLMQLRKVCNHPDLFEVRPVRTSFAMEKSVLGDYEPSEILVRKRLLQTQDEISLEAYNLIIQQEDQSAWACQSRKSLDASDLLPYVVEMPTKGSQSSPPEVDTRTIDGWKVHQRYAQKQASIARWRAIAEINRRRCQVRPVYGSTFLDMVSSLPNTLLPHNLTARSQNDLIDSFVPPVAPLVHSFADRAKQVSKLLDYYAVMPPNVVARDLPRYALPGLETAAHPSLLEPEFDTLHQATVKLQIAFPDLSLLQYDCGKLQKLDEMLRDLKANGHRVLIFTQMTRVLDILETFLSYNGHRYLRLDGSTKIEDRQIITERFNSDSRIFCFIASSRSGGVGINLTGADTVFFYDSDWNPSMDRQCMDRAHRIGQTREVHIYRFVSIHTVEENMLKKANQKRLLDRVVIQDGDFTTDFFGKMDWRELIDAPPDISAKITEEVETERVEDIDVENEPEAVEVETVRPRVGEEREFAKALAEVEDEEDAAAARIAQGENELDFAEFEDGVPKRPALDQARSKELLRGSVEGSATPMDVDTPMEVEQDVEKGEEEEEEEEEDVGAVDEYMLKWVEEDWDWFVSY